MSYLRGIDREDLTAQKVADQIKILRQTEHQMNVAPDDYVAGNGMYQALYNIAIKALADISLALDGE